ncbi:hypothetical protein BJF83_03980 [Nocardiopsis sp. CNR-923]|nr:hypothetical protein BJF83_03980 [Nocardiopsis sp. CNR-923]
MKAVPMTRSDQRTPTTERTPGAQRPGARLPLLDVLRGIAILGTLGTNVWLFTARGGEGVMLYGTDVLSPLGAFLTDPSAAGLAQGVFLLFTNGTFLSLLTLLFGVGLAVQFRSASRRGGRWPGPYTWRWGYVFPAEAVGQHRGFDPGRACLPCGLSIW